MTENTNTIQEILSISYNQDQGSFVCGTIYGFKVYNTYPFKKVLIRDLGGSICLAEMLYRTNILALVGGGPIPKYAPNKVLLWDDHRGKFGGEMKFKSDVKSIKLRQNKIAIALQDKIYVYKLQDLTVLTSIETCYNPKGMFCFSVNETILCCPDKEEIGFFNILNLESKSLITKKAHSSSVAYMEISPKGDLIATTSDHGTLLRVFSATDGALVHEFRRGTDHVTIQSISFSLDSAWLSCNTDTGKIDIFNLEGDKPNSKKEPPKNTKSKLSFLKVVHPYFDSQWSYAHLDKNYKRANLVFLTQGNLKLIVVTTYEGTYHLISFDAKHGKDGMELEKGNFLALDPTQP